MIVLLPSGTKFKIGVGGEGKPFVFSAGNDGNHSIAEAAPRFGATRREPSEWEGSAATGGGTMPQAIHSVEDAPPTIDFIKSQRGVFIAFGGPRGHGDSLAVLAPQFLAEQTCTLLGRARHRAAGARFSIS